MMPRHEHERAYRLHRQKLEMIKPSLDNNTPKQYPHLVYRNKSIKNEEEKLSQVDHENAILLNKMTHIMKTGGRVDNWNDQPTKRKIDSYKKQRHEKMLLENVQIAKRLESVKPTYDKQIWEGDYKRHEQYLEMRQENAKDPIYGTPSQRKKKGEKDDYESDFESDDEGDAKKNHKSKKSDDKPPKASPRDGEVDLSMYWGDYKEQEDQDKKDSSRGEKTKGAGANKNESKDKDKNKKNKKAGDEDNKNDLQSDRDVKQLFKVSKELLDEEESKDVLIKTLVKKSHKQRMEIKAKFKEKYDLDLDKELKEGLGSDWNVIIDALLTEQDLADAENLHNAIQNQNTNSIIEIIGTKDNKTLSQLKEAYRKEYSKSVESAINEKYKDPTELFLVTISKTNKDESSDVDGKTAQKDAVELYESGDGRWTTASGKFIKLLDSKSISHTQTVLKLYKQVAGGKEALDSMKSECSSDYTEAVNSYVNCTKDPEAFHAEKLFRNIGHSNPAFVNTLVARSEIDMPAVCKTYKKKYDADIKEDIDDRCAEPTRKVLKALASKSPKPKKGGGDGKQGSKKGPGQSEGPTVKADDNFNPDDDCERLRKAMDGLGTDEQTIIDIICSKNNSQRQTLKQKYAQKYKKRDLVSDLKSELSGDFEEVILALMMPPDQYDVHCFHEALSGVGTDESMLLTLLATKTSSEMKSIKSEYKKAYKKDLDKAIESDTSGDFRELLLALSKGDKPQGSTVNQKEAEEDAKKIHMDGKGKPDDEVFKTLMTKNNSAQIKATFAEYKKLSGKDIYDTMKKSLKGDAKDAYITLGKMCESDEATFYCDQLKEAADGMGTNDSKLIRTIVTRSEIDLGTIKGKYKKKNKKTLNDMVDSECSGDYKKALLKIIGENQDDEDEEEEQDEEAAVSPKKSKAKTTKTAAAPVANKSNKSKGKQDPKTKDKMDDKGKNSNKTIQNKTQKENKTTKSTKTDKEKTGKNKDGEKSKGKENEKERSIDDEVERLYKAMDGLGTDEQTIIDVIVTKKNQQRQEIRQKYQERYNKDVMSDLKSELSGDLQEVILGLMMTPSEYDVDCLHEAMSGMGTDESMLIGILATQTPEELKNIKELYKTEYKKDLEKDIKSETSGDFKELLLELVKGQRPQDDKVEEKVSEDEAKKLNKNGKGKLDKKHFKSIFTKYNNKQVPAIFEEYKKLSDKDVHELIEENMKGDVKNGYICLVKSYEDPVDYYVERLHGAFDGFGTNDSRLIRILVSRSEVDLPGIKEKYKEIYNKSLNEEIKSECSGDYKTALLLLIGEEDPQTSTSKSTDEIKTKDGDKSKDDGKSKDDNKSKDDEKYIDDEVERLYKAMDGLGTDEQTIIDVIVTKKNQQRQEIRQKYQERYNKDVMSDLKSELSGDLQEVILGLMMTPSEYDVDCLHEAMSGMGTDESMLIGILATQTPEELRNIKELYKTEYKKDLDKDIKSETSGDFKELLLELVKGQRPQGDKVEEKISEDEAKKLNKNGKGKLDKKHFKSIFTKYNNKQVPAIFEEYKKLSDKDVHELIEENMKGDVKNGYICLVKSYEDPVDYYVERLHGAFDGVGTNDSRLIRILVSRSEIDLTGIKEKYKEIYNKSLNEEIKSECSGDYKTALLLLIGEEDPQTSTSTDKIKTNDEKKDGEKSKDDDKYIYDEVERLYKAMDGLGTDEQTIIDVIVTKKNQQRQEIRQKYKKRYEKDVMSGLKSELSGDLQEVILGLMMTPSEYDVDCLHEAMSGMGTDESMLIGILATRTPEELKNIKVQYKSEYKRDLEKDIKSETSGDFKELLLELVKGQRPQGDKVEEKISEDEAKKLNKNGNGKLDKKHFKSIFTKYNNKQVPAIFEEYKKLSDKDVHELIEENMKGDVKNGYSCLVKSYEDPVDYYVERLHGAFDGVGTNDSRLIRILVSRSEIDLACIKEKYKEIYNKSLNEEIKSECSGDYKTALLLLIGGDDPPNKKDDTLKEDKTERKVTSKSYTEKVVQGRGENKDGDKSKDDGKDDVKSKDDEKYIDDEVEKLYKAMDGLGTDEQTIIDVIVTKKNQQRQEIRQKYQERYNKDVMSDLKSELSGDLQEVILGLMMTPSEYDVDCLHEAMSGMGTDESMLIGVLAARTSQEIVNIKEQYKNKYKKDLEKNIKSETSGDFKELLLELVKGQRPQGDKVDDKISNTEAMKLYKGKQKFDVKVFKLIFINHNKDQVRSILKHYEEISNTDIDKTMKDNLNKDAYIGYSTLVKSYEEPVDYYVERLHGAFDGVGTNDSRLIRILVSRSEIDLAGIKEKYKEIYNKSLTEEIKSECSGDYETALLLLIGEDKDDDKKLDETKQTKDKNDSTGKGTKRAKSIHGSETENANLKDNDTAATKDSKPENSKEEKEEVFENLPDEVDRLYKAMDGIGTDERTIIYVIVTKTNQQRQEIRQKYNERYKKDVMSDLRSELSGDLQEVILGLMMTPSEYDVDCLHEAMSGMGTDESMLIGILATRTSEEMKKVKDLYKKKYKKDLEKDIKSETSGDFKELLLELVKGQRPQGDKVADKVSNTEAMKLYKNSKTKLDMKQFKSIFTKYNGSQIKAIFDEYEKLYEKSCAQLIDENLKNDSKSGYRCLVTYSYEDPVDYYVERLHGAFDGVGTNDSRLIRILVSRSEIDLAGIKEKYKEIYNKSLNEEIKSECSGDYKTALLLLIGEESSKEYKHETSDEVSKEDTSSKERKKNDDLESDDYDAIDDSRILWKAMDGFGTNEDDIIKILGNRNKHQRQEIIKAFKSKYKKDLIKELKNELSGKLLETVLALMADSLQYDVQTLRTAVSGFSTDNRMVFHIMGTKSKTERLNLDKAFKEAHKKTLKDIVNKECKGVVQKLLFKILSSDERSNTEYQNKSLTELVELLYNDGKPIFKTNPELLFNILNSHDNHTSLYEEFAKQTDKTFIESLKHTLSGDDECVMLAFVNWLNGPIKYYSTSLYESMAGLGTNNSLLIHILVSRSEIDLEDIKEEFKETYGKSLEDCIEKECSGDYKTMLLTILNKQ